LIASAITSAGAISAFICAPNRIRKSSSGSKLAGSAIATVTTPSALDSGSSRFFFA